MVEWDMLEPAASARLPTRRAPSATGTNRRFIFVSFREGEESHKRPAGIYNRDQVRARAASGTRRFFAREWSVSGCEGLQNARSAGRRMRGAGQSLRCAAAPAPRERAVAA